MASQAKSGFSCEGTQYATDSSYYVLDLLSGTGSVIEGPVSITNSLAVLGSATVSQDLGVSGFTTTSGLFQRATAAQPLLITGSGTATGGIQMNLPTAATGTVTISSADVGGRPNRITLQNPAETLADGYGCDVNQKLRLNAGLALAPTDGTNQAPAVAVLSGPSYFFQMTSNKAFITTPGPPGANPVMIVRFPPGLIPGANNMIPLIGPPRSGVQANILSYGIDGDGFQVTILCQDPTRVMTFSIVVL